MPIKFIKYIGLVLGSICLLQACKDAPKPETVNPNLLPVSTINNPRTVEGATVDINNLGKLVFADSVHDFGKLKQGDVVECDFEYINTGKSAVMITDAKASCGCTVPDYKREPIQPGEKGVMKVKFNSAGKFGEVNKVVTVTTNGNPSVMTVCIQALMNK
jgi:Protein of unknown function (DUF1573)